MPESQIRRRLLSANTTAATAAVAAGMYTVATLATALSLTEAQVRERILALGPSVPSAMGRRRGVEVSLIGTGGDDSTFTAAVYQLKYGVDRSNQNQQTPDFELVPLCLLSATLSAAVGAASGTLVLSTERIADAIVVTVYNPSTTPKGESKIRALLSPGAGVVTTRHMVQHVVTEYGVAHLRGRNLAERARALIAVPHPSVREELERAAAGRFGYSFLRLKA